MATKHKPIYRLFSREEEAALAARMHAGDLAARDALIESQLAWIRRVAFRFARDPDQCDELIAEGNCKLVELMPKFDPAKARLSTFVGLCLFNHFARWHQLLRQKTHVQFEELREPTVVDDLDASAHRAQVNQAVQAAIRRLPERERDVLCRRMRGETLAAIGLALGVCKERVRQIETKARRRLEPQLARWAA